MISFRLGRTPTAVVGSKPWSSPAWGGANPQVRVEGMIIEPASAVDSRDRNGAPRPSRRGLLELSWQLRRWLAREWVAVDGMSDAEVVEAAESRLERGQWRVTKAPERAIVARCVPMIDAYVPLASLGLADDAPSERDPIEPSPRRPLTSLRATAEPSKVCWPCRQAAAAGRALRQASAQGAPFILDA